MLQLGYELINKFSEIVRHERERERLFMQNDDTNVINYHVYTMSMSIMCMCVRKGKKVFLDRCNNIIGKNYVSNTYYLVDALH